MTTTVPAWTSWKPWRLLLCEAVFQTGALLMAKLMGGGKDWGGPATGEGRGVPLLTKVTEVRFRLPVYPGDTVLIEKAGEIIPQVVSVRREKRHWPLSSLISSHA